MDILDMNMPEISGVEVVKSLRFMDATHSLPIIMLTADATPEAKEASLNAGASAFLTKPINVKTLLEKIAVLTRDIHRESANKKYKPASNELIVSDFPESPWFDETVLQDLSMLGNGPQFVRDLLDNFIIDGTRHVERIKIAASHDYLDYREALHALKGSSTELGAARLVNICIKGEALKPYDMGSDKIKTLSRELDNVFELTTNAFNEISADRNRSNSDKSE